MADEKVLMEHPDIKHTQDRPVLVSKASFEKVWKAKGWKRATTKKEK